MHVRSLRSRFVRATTVVVAVLSALLHTRTGRAAEPEPDYQHWVQLYVDGNMDRWVKGLRFFADLQARRTNAPLTYHRDPSSGDVVAVTQNPNTSLLFRPAIGYQWAKWGNAFVGYGWTPTFYDDVEQRRARNVDEHRIYEQVGFFWKIPWLDVSSRTRVEQRVRTNGPGSAENDAGLSHWAHRLRQAVRFAFTLKPGHPWQIIVYDEFFFHLNRTNYVSYPGFDQNRAFAGVGYDTPGFRAELGYMNQYVHRYTDPHQVNHVLAVSLAVKIGPKHAQPAVQLTAPHG